MGLEEYIKKRDFKRSPEPGPDYSNDNRGRFVIQRHQASRLHYDLRLEMEGVLKSWAVPKGPSMNPKDKRLAIQTEDHPVKYLHFKGTIPKGNYGAGVMDIWDSGTYQAAGGSPDKLPDQLKKGNLKISFSGKRIKGEFALVRTSRGDREDQWLLMKKKDEHATDLEYDAEVFANKATNEKWPTAGKIKNIRTEDFIRPMLATATKKIFNAPDWIYELKWDGYRVIANIKEGRVNLYSRNGISMNRKFEKLQKELEPIPHEVILDGEVVVLNQEGMADFQLLQNFDQHSPEPLRYYVFDMLYLNGHSMLDLPLTERKSLLPEVLEGLDQVQYCDHIEGMGTAFFEQAVAAGMEGVIAKKADASYIPGYRSENWLKIKAVQSLEALICGYTSSEASIFGSLILGVFSEGVLTHIGNVGSGFSQEEQKALLELFRSYEVPETPFPVKIALKGRKPTWLQPELICEVTYSEMTKKGHLRHPVFKALRSEKTPGEIIPEKKTEPPRKAARGYAGASLEVDGVAVEFTNLEKVYWPDSGFRKYDLIDYYIQMSDRMLPYLRDRPQNLHRHPNGITKKGFYQKDTQGQMPSWVERISIYSESSQKSIEYLLCQKEATLLYMANLGCIEINPWNSRKDQLDHPDFTVIDLDPSKENTFEEVITVAQAAKEVLDQAAIRGYCKTSGSSGLHIYIPLGASYTYDQARDFTKLLCYFIQEKVPELTSLERAVKSRKGRIYLDYLQNRRGQTLAAPYCVRPKPGAPVSAPISWDKVKAGLNILDFNLENMPGLAREGKDPFQAVLGKGIEMEKAIKKLES